MAEPIDLGKTRQARRAQSDETIKAVLEQAAGTALVANWSLTQFIQAASDAWRRERR